MKYVDVGQGTPLLFVHGFPFTSSAWEKQVEALKATYRVIVPTLPEARSIGEFADRIRSLIDERNLGSVVLIGHSMGGYIALNFSLRYPSLLKGLVLVATKSAPDTPEAAAGRRTLAEKIKQEGPGSVIETMSPKMLGKSNATLEKLQTVRHLMNMAPQTMISALLAMAEREDTTSRLSEIRVPTLVITGDEDVLIPASESEKMAKLLPHATLKMIPQTGHLLFYEKPQELNRALTEWLP